MQPSKKKAKQISIETTDGLSPVMIYANVFGVETFEDTKLLHFGCQLPKDRTFSEWACFIEKRLIVDHKADWLGYLQKSNFPAAAAEGEFRCTFGKNDHVPIANVVLWSRSGEYAETRFMLFSLHDLHLKNLGKLPTLKASPLAIIRSTIEMQRQLIEFLYRELSDQ